MSSTGFVFLDFRVGKGDGQVVPRKCPLVDLLAVKLDAIK